MTTSQPIHNSEAKYADRAENYGGFCADCSDQVFGVEPDARQYRCEACNAEAVFGVEELLIRGVICFSNE